LWESYYEKDKWHSRKLVKTTSSDGLAQFELRNIGSSRNLYAAAASNMAGKDRQAFAAGSAGNDNREGDAWRIYAYTDRPAYRPQETVQWNSLRVDW